MNDLGIDRGAGYEECGRTVQPFSNGERRLSNCGRADSGGMARRTVALDNERSASRGRLRAKMKVGHYVALHRYLDRPTVD